MPLNKRRRKKTFYNLQTRLEDQADVCVITRQVTINEIPTPNPAAPKPLISHYWPLIISHFPNLQCRHMPCWDTKLWKQTDDKPAIVVWSK